MLRGRDLLSGGIGSGGRYVDEHGRPVKRTPLTHPYSYDPYVIWQAEGDANGGCYSDRLLEWDWDKHNELCRKHFGDDGQRWDNREPEKIEAFLRDFHGIPDLKLIRIMQGANQSSGYPYWYFAWYYENGKTVD